MSIRHASILTPITTRHLHRARISSLSTTSLLTSSLPIRRHQATQTSTKPQPLQTLSFWKCRHTWRRAMVNTTRCLIGCSLGDLSTMTYLMTYHPEMNAATSMSLSMTAGITTSILLETALLHHGKDRLPWLGAVRTACGMSLVSMLAMELTENLVTLGLVDNSMSLADPSFWAVTGLSMLAGGKKDKSLTKVLKNAFGFRSTHDDDFANQLAPRIGLD
ncbi:hypothetical protein Q7P35_007560 [Cladosporium inversicolor]